MAIDEPCCLDEPATAPQREHVRDDAIASRFARLLRASQRAPVRTSADRTGPDRTRPDQSLRPAAIAARRGSG